MTTQIIREIMKFNKTISSAESCTGGLIAHKLTCETGSSKMFKAGLVTYTNESKMKELGVSHYSICTKGVVSSQVAREMAIGAIEKFHTDIAIATTGYAEPHVHNEPQQAYIAIAYLSEPSLLKTNLSIECKVICVKLKYPKNRYSFTNYVADDAIELIYNTLKEMG